MSDAAAKAELDRYFDWIEQHVPGWLGRFLHWLRQPQMLIARIIVSLLLVLGGLLSFLPILGLWMLPLGLLILSEDLPFLQPPLVRFLGWIELKWQNGRDRSSG